MVKRLSEFEGVVGRVGRCNAKDIPKPNISHTESDVSKSIIHLTKLINTIQGKLAPGADPSSPTRPSREKKQSLREAINAVSHKPAAVTENILRQIRHAYSARGDDTEYFTNIDAVLRVKRLTKGAVISTLDKADSSMVAM